MHIVKVGSDVYLNLDRLTYVEPGKKGRLHVHFAVASDNLGKPSCEVVLEGAEADALRRRLDAPSAHDRSERS